MEYIQKRNIFSEKKKHIFYSVVFGSGFYVEMFGYNRELNRGK